MVISVITIKYSVQETSEDNPVQIDSFGSLKHHTEFFLKLCPFHADLT